MVYGIGVDPDSLGYSIQLFRGYAGNSQIIVPRWWRRSGKLLPEAEGPGSQIFSTTEG